MRSLLFIFSFISLFAHAQVNNLVPNPSFEAYIDCPQHSAQIENAVPWFSPLTPLSTSEYFNTCCTIPANSGGVSVPDNEFGYQFARTGNGYAGIEVYQTGKRREYLEVELIQSLSGEKEYCVEFFYSLSEYTPVFISLISVYFSNVSILSDSTNPLPVSPQVYLPVTIDSLGWVRFYSSFTAEGGEKFITIGNFEPDLSGEGINYSFIDDVSVYLCDDTLPKPQELKIPNVFTPDNDEFNDLFVIENLTEGASVQVYNRWGVLVAEWNTPNGSWDGRMKGGGEASAGVYYYIVNLPDGERRKGFVQLIR